MDNWYNKYDKCHSSSIETNFRNVWNVCFTNYSSNFNHLWRNGFLSFNKLLLCYLFSFYLHVWSSPHRGLLHTIFCITYSRICHGNFLREFAVAICCRNLLWEFVVVICLGFFVFVSKSFFVYLSKFCLYGSKPFLYVIFFISTNSVFFCYCCGSYGPPYKWMWISLKKSFKFIIFQVIMFSQNVINLTHF